MNTKLVTTGLVPYTIGSTEKFLHEAVKDGVPWDLTPATVTLTISDPNGATYVLPASIAGGIAFAFWTIIGPIGTWVMAWTITDPSVSPTIVQVSQPIIFTVISSPA